MSSSAKTKNAAMSNPNSPPTASLNNYLEHTGSFLSNVAGYMRLPALASTVCGPARVPKVGRCGNLKRKRKRASTAFSCGSILVHEIGLRAN